MMEIAGYVFLWWLSGYAGMLAALLIVNRAYPSLGGAWEQITYKDLFACCFFAFGGAAALIIGPIVAVAVCFEKYFPNAGWNKSPFARKP